MRNPVHTDSLLRRRRAATTTTHFCQFTQQLKPDMKPGHWVSDFGLVMSGHARVSVSD